MATKKIIAICQSGGEFLNSKDDGSLSYSGGEAYALDVDLETKLNDLKQELADTFQCSVHGMSIKYFLPGNKKTLITISKDKDLQRMVNIFKDSIQDQVEVFIISEEGVARNVSDMPASRSSRAAVPEAIVLPVARVDSIRDDQMDMYVADEATPCVASNDEKHCRVTMQWKNNITGVDQRFTSSIEFRDALHKYSIAHGFAYKYKKNDSHRISAKCKSEGCPWRIYASRLPTTQLICIKKMNNKHTCINASIKAGGRATRGWVGSIIKEKLKVSPNYKPKDIANDIKREYGIQINYSQARRAKEIAREQLQGSYKEAYNQLPFLCEKIVETNPGSFATFKTKEDSSFHRLFVSFYASILGFQQGCRPLLFLDCAPLYSKHGGMLLVATTADGDDGVFPVAFAVVDDETDDNWHWFLMELKSALSTSQPITFVANFQKGLRESLLTAFGKDCYHGFCLRHLSKKLNKDLKGTFSYEARRLMVQDLYAAAYASKLEAFEQSTENIRAISPDAYNWVIRSEPDRWANAFFGGARYNHLTSNFGQLFYSWVSEVKELPITKLIDELRGKMMELIYTRRMDSNQWQTVLTPSMEAKLQNEASKSQSFQVVHRLGSTFEVRGESVDTVDIDHCDCSCKGWQLTGLPCCHAIAIFKCTGRNSYDYCSRYFTTESYRLTYAESIHPVPNVEAPVRSELAQEVMTITPPPAKHRTGRPKMKLIETEEIIKRQLQCSKCKGIGHNKRTCDMKDDDVTDTISLSGPVTMEQI